MTTTAEANGTALAVREYPKLAALTGYTNEQINLIRQTVATGASIVEVAWYLYNAKRLGLEPTLDQIYLIKYGNNPADIVIGINGYRAQAESSGVYAGSDDAVYEYEDVGQPKRAPSKATVTVWKIVQGQRVPFTASARWEEFYPGDGKVGEQYRKRPHNQLAVRAESHALRKGFPYQTARLDVQEVLPSGWVEAVESDEVRHRSPAHQAALAATHDRVYGTEADLQDPMGAAARRAAPAEPQPPAATAPKPEMVSTRSQLGQKLAALVEEAARLEVDFSDAQIEFPASKETVLRLIEKLEDRIQRKKDGNATAAPEQPALEDIPF